jgi:hypothetical protein
MFLNLIMSGKESKHLFIMPHNLFHHFLFWNFICFIPIVSPQKDFWQDVCCS